MMRQKDWHLVRPWTLCCAADVPARNPPPEEAEKLKQRPASRIWVCS